jgi:hypothetical protein
VALAVLCGKRLDGEIALHSLAHLPHQCSL